MKNKISVEVINNNLHDLPFNAIGHCVFHLLPQNEEKEIFITHSEYNYDEVVGLQKLPYCNYFEEGTHEYDFLKDILKRFQYKKVVE